jgi:hypothetical protein
MYRVGYIPCLQHSYFGLQGSQTSPFSGKMGSSKGLYGWRSFGFQPILKDDETGNENQTLLALWLKNKDE